MEKWRLLELEDVDGPTSAAVDEALLTAVGAGQSPSSLRFYTWSGSWLCLGSAQTARQEVDLAACERLGIEVCRRLSGGTATLNEHILGFSLVVPTGHALATGGIIDTYRRVGPALLAAMEALSLDVEAVAPEQTRLSDPDDPAAAIARKFCFLGLAPYEVLSRGRKLVGHSQVRRRQAILYHGAMLLDFDPWRLASVLRFSEEAERELAAEHLAARVTSLRQAQGPAAASAGEAAAALERAFRSVLGIDLGPGDLTSPEADLALSLREQKYANQEWTFRR